tara:strand:+ start:1805 stop:2059 length:255 start_codon:yes stop_codon:yes gene_type:complete
LKEWHRLYAGRGDVTPKDEGQIDTNCIDFKFIQEHLNGFARVIYFRKETAPKKNIYVTSVKEGRMKNGYFEGFARELEAILCTD